MTEDRPVSEAYFLAVSAIGDQVGKPLPKGINRATVGDWNLTLNASLEPVELDGGTKLPPYELFAENTVYLAIAMFGPYGGEIGGMTEDRFIADMKAGSHPEPQEGTVRLDPCWLCGGVVLIESRAAPLITTRCTDCLVTETRRIIRWSTMTASP